MGSSAGMVLDDDLGAAAAGRRAAAARRPAREETPMPATPLHPAIVHLPLGLAMIQPLLLAALAWAIARDKLPTRAFWIGVALQVLIFGGGLVAMRTGEADEDRVERVVAGAAIESHEAAAQVFVWASGLGVAAVAGAALTAGARLGTAARFGAAGASAVVLALALLAGKSGGEIVYVHGGAQAFASAAGAGAIAPAGLPGRDDD